MIRFLKLEKEKREDIKGTNILLFILVIVFSFVVFIGDKGFFEYQKLKDKKEVLQLEIGDLSYQRAFMQEKLTALKTGNWLLENIAREKLGMIKKDEKVFQIEYEDAEN